MFLSKILADELLKNNYKLLGQIPISDEDYAKLATYVKNRLQYSRSHISVDIKLSVFAVQVAIREYKEGRYWPCFCSVIGENISTAKQNFVGQTFLQTIRAFDLMIFEREEGGSQMFVENIKAHAFVTNWYLDGFFEFSYAYFENNLFRQLPEDIEEDFYDLSQFMTSTLKRNTDVISETGNENKTARSYKLLKSTRTVMSQADPDLLKALFYPTLQYIDHYFYDGDFSAEDNRIAISFENWCKKREKEKKKISTGSTKKRCFYSQKPYIKYDLLDNHTILIIPRQKFRNDECNGTAKVEITINDVTVSKELELYRSFGIFISEELIVAIPDPFLAVQVEIITEITKKYDIYASNYRIFNSNWELVNKFSVGNNHLLVKQDEKVVFQDTIIIDEDYIGLDWKHFYVRFTNDSVCFISTLMVSTIGEFSYDPIYEDPISDFKILDQKGYEYQLTRNHPVVSFLVDKRKLKGTVLEINGMRKPLSDFKNTTNVVWPQDESLRAVTIRLENEDFFISDGSYEIVANIPGENVKHLAKYFLLRKLKCRIPTNIYVFADCGSLTVHNDERGYVEVPDEWERKILFDGGIKYYFPLDDYVEHIDVSLLINHERFILRTPVKMFAYGFSKEVLQTKAISYLWYSDLRESLYVKLPEARNISASIKGNRENAVMGEPLGDGLFRLDITSIISVINDDMRMSSFTIDIDFDTDRHRWLSLPEILRKIKIWPYFVLETDENGVYTEINIQGNAEISINVLDHTTREVILANKILSSGKNYLEGLCVSGFYDIHPKMIESDGFFSTKEEPLKYVRGTGVVCKDNLVNCSLPIYSLIYKEQEFFFNEQKLFIEIETQIEKNEYEGVLKQLVPTASKKYYSKELGKVSVSVYKNLDNTLTITFLMYSYADADWSAPFFNKKTKQLISCDNGELMRSRAYNLFLLLDEDEAEYSICTKKIRRFR